MSATTTRPAEKRPGATASPTFGAWKVTVRSASTASTRDLAGRGVDAGGNVDRDDRGLGLVHAPDQLGGVRAWLTAEPRAEERVDDHVVPRRVVRLVGDVPGLAKNARGDTSVSAVRAAAADAREAACRRKREHGLACDRRTRALHQLGNAVRIVRVALLGRAHLRSRVERLEALSHPRGARRPRWQPRSRANASSTDRSARPGRARRRRRSAPTTALPASAGRRSRSPST